MDILVYKFIYICILSVFLNLFNTYIYKRNLIYNI